MDGMGRAKARREDGVYWILLGVICTQPIGTTGIGLDHYLYTHVPSVLTTFISVFVHARHTFPTHRGDRR